ncbi:hypothetical protein TIFTF001_053321 [Ficus carica]|uniref:Uncharacterized protein n=1 Tax=Ficus carica TaxID=3494 RepID=A0AA88EAX0_FICCA|nr:hypothetical protein TIFTF001_053321 [Ficus carica]
METFGRVITCHQKQWCERATQARVHVTPLHEAGLGRSDGAGKPPRHAPAPFLAEKSPFTASVVWARYSKRAAAPHSAPNPL